MQKSLNLPKKNFTSQSVFLSNQKEQQHKENYEKVQAKTENKWKFEKN